MMGMYFLSVSLCLGSPVASKPLSSSYGTLSASRRPPDRPRADKAKGLTYDSIVANESRTQIHREFILYGHEAAAYPEYVIKYIEN